MDRKNSKAQRRKEAREYFDTHDVDLSGEEVALEIRKPLSTIMSIRLDEEHVAKLKRLAKAQGVGVTTMARLLLNQAIDRPGSQMLLAGFTRRKIEHEVNEIAENAANPNGPATMFYVLPKADFEQSMSSLQAALLASALGVVKERSLKVTEASGPIFDQLRQELEEGVAEL